jgi:16S rRNA (guanine966-N2)-methyltransferase
VRVIAGKFRGLRLKSIGSTPTNKSLRPTTDRVRENLFNILAGGKYGNILDGARVLDMFSGTGILGIEAISRGASHATLIEKCASTFKLIQDNIKLTNTVNEINTINTNVMHLEQCKTEPFNLIFIDPPYQKKFGEPALERALKFGWLSVGALIVWEESVSPEVPKEFQWVDEKKYGKTILTFLTAP